MSKEYELKYTAIEIDQKLDTVGEHTEQISSLNDEIETVKESIPTIPESLPANGGNADTIDGKHADDFAVTDHEHTEYAINDNVVPNTRTVNGKSLTDNIELTVEDIGADVAGTAETKANEALESAKEYTNTSISKKANTEDLTNHTEDLTIHVTEEDKSKWDNKLDIDHNHDDVYYTETEVDTKFTTVNQSVDTLNSEVETIKGDLTSHANTSNTQFETIRSEFAQADTNTLTTAKEYSDANKSAAVTEAKAYTDSEIEKLVTDTEFEGVLTTIQEIQDAMATDTELAQALEEANGKKIDKVEKGSSTKPIYLDSTGTPQEIAYKIEQDLPADAKLTDTTYTLIKDATQKKIQLMSGETLVSEVDDNNTTYEVATTNNSGLLSAEDKTKLDGVETGANAYTHPTTSGNKHIPSGGSEGQVLTYSADGTAQWSEPPSSGIDGLTATVDELNYSSGLTGNIQEQLDELNKSFFFR